MIQIDSSRCISCGLCVSDCVSSALTLEPAAVLRFPENCIGCGHCIAICPREAVSDDALDMTEVHPISQPVSAEALLGQMRSRRSCRHFQADPVPEALLQTLLESARVCPTAKNVQGTRYIAVTNQLDWLLDEALRTLGQIGIHQRATATAPDEQRRAESFIRWSETRMADKDFDPLFFHAPLLLLFVSEPSGAYDAAAAAAYAELMAGSLGLGCLYSGYFTACAGLSRPIQEHLQLKQNEQVIRSLVLGYPDVRFRRTAPRKPIDLTRI